MTQKLKAALADGLGEEPTLIIQAVDAGLQVLQVSLVDVPVYVHAIIAAIIVTLAALINRQVVSPAPSFAARLRSTPATPPVA